jgi:hypothetical protein
MNQLPIDMVELIYYKLHRSCMRDVREELCGADEHFFWLPRDQDTDTDESYSYYSSDSDESEED